MKKTDLIKTSKNQWLLWAVAGVIIAPLIINIGLIATDAIYENSKTLLTAKGLSNADWLDFWKQYLAIIISFVGVSLVYLSSKKDREKSIQEKNAQQYLEEVRREENVLVEVIQQFNTGILYNALMLQSGSTGCEGIKLIADTRTSINTAYIKFEMLTSLCDDFKKCESCPNSPCVDSELMKDLRGIFEDIEKHYWEMLDLGEQYLNLLREETRRLELLTNEKRLCRDIERFINSCGDRYADEVAELIEEQAKLKESIAEHERVKMSQEINQGWLNKIKDEITYIDQEARPKFIRYCKIYIDEKKNHSIELRTTGTIQYRKVKTIA